MGVPMPTVAHHRQWSMLIAGTPALGRSCGMVGAARSPRATQRAELAHSLTFVGITQAAAAEVAREVQGVNVLVNNAGGWE